MALWYSGGDMLPPRRPMSSTRNQHSVSTSFIHTKRASLAPHLSPAATGTTSLSTAVGEGAAELMGLSVPPNAAQILLGAMDAQRQSSFLFSLRVSENEEEVAMKKARLQMQLRQQHRRDEWAALDHDAQLETEGMLVEVAAAVEEQLTSLRPEGYQAFAFHNEDVYEGNWKNCRMHGKGCLRRHGMGDIYEGQWFLGTRSGTGTYHCSGASLMFYNGAWLDNKCHGKGELVEAEGVFVGEFVDNRIHGYGEYVYNDGHVYKGEWVGGLYEGTGTYLYPSGAKYEGQWRRGVECGRGTKTFFDGDTYVGEWRHGTPHGFGTYSSGRMVLDGEWVYGSLQGHAVCHFTDGSSYEGEWHSNEFHGNGLYTGPNGDYYVGTFVHGRREGRGEYGSEHVWYRGEWEGDLKHGTGVIQVSGCQLMRARWVHDVPYDAETLTDVEGDNDRAATEELADTVVTAIQRQRALRRVDCTLQVPLPEGPLWRHPTILPPTVAPPRESAVE